MNIIDYSKVCRKKKLEIHSCNAFGTNIFSKIPLSFFIKKFIILKVVVKTNINLRTSTQLITNTEVLYSLIFPFLIYPLFLIYDELVMTHTR